MKATRRSRQKAFTIVELVILIAVIAILAAVLIPTFSSIIKSANNSADQQLVTNLNKIAAAHYGNTDNEFEFADNIRKMLDEDGYKKDSLVTKNSDVIIVYDTQSNKFERKVLHESGDRLVVFAEDDNSYVGYYLEEIFENQIIISIGGNALAEAIYKLHNLPSGVDGNYIEEYYNKIPNALKDNVKTILKSSVMITEDGKAVAINFNGEVPSVTGVTEPKSRIIFSEDASIVELDVDVDNMPEKVIIPNNVAAISGDFSNTEVAGKATAVEGETKGTCTIEHARGLKDSGSTGGETEHVHDYEGQPAIPNGDGTHYYECKGYEECHTTKSEECFGGEANHFEKAECEACGQKYGNTVAHEFTKQKTDGEYLASEATCEQLAKYYFSCECGEKDSVNTFESGDYADHKLENRHTEKKDATCTEAGNVEYWTCEYCKQNFNADNEVIEDITINALGHQYVDEWIPDNNGNHYHQCERYEDCKSYQTEECKYENYECSKCGHQLIYSVTLNNHNAAHGTVAVNCGDTVKGGAELTVTITPNAGYNIYQFKINGSTLTAQKQDYRYIYKFTLTDDTTIEVSFIEEGVTPTDSALLATFTLGVDGAATHNDGSSKSGANAYTETNGSYILSVAGGTQFYTGARDAKGNGCFKLGSSGNTGSFAFTVGADVKHVVIYVAGYKTNKAEISINGASVVAIDKLSDNGEYFSIEIDTTTTKTIEVSTTSSAKRCMINTIEFWG